MADAGGLSQSYQAWNKRFKGDPAGSKYQNYLLPGLNYTREQLFYISKLWAPAILGALPSANLKL